MGWHSQPGQDIGRDATLDSQVTLAMQKIFEVCTPISCTASAEMPARRVFLNDGNNVSARCATPREDVISNNTAKAAKHAKKEWNGLGSGSCREKPIELNGTCYDFRATSVKHESVAAARFRELGIFLDRQ